MALFHLCANIGWIQGHFNFTENSLRYRVGQARYLSLRFQSLLSWMLLSNAEELGWHSVDATVSILVILDVALKQCAGLISSRNFSWFQSLLSWMLLSNTVGRIWLLRAYPQFQSLLSWMLLSNIRSCRFSARSFIGFNPCYPGCCSQTPVRRDPGKHQSGFNPCYPGCCSQTTAVLLRWLASSSFNPCYPGCCSQTVVVMGIEGLDRCFNPCYPGCCSQTGVTLPDPSPGNEVSILVILDVALKRNRWYPSFDGPV